MSHDLKVMRFGPEVDTQFSHRSDTSIENVKMTKHLQKHTPLFRVQVDSLCCTLSIQGTYSEKVSVNRRTILILLSASLLKMQIKLGPYTIQRHNFCVG